MKTHFLLVGLLAVLLILPACNKKEETPKAPAAPQQQAQPVPMQQAQTPQTGAPADQAMSPSGPMVAEDMAKGEKIYDEACKSCHEEGIAGAPKLGDKEAWADRITQGMDTLENNAINGFTGKTGTMPPKGGNGDLTDEDVKAAVAYMVSKSK